MKRKLGIHFFQQWFNLADLSCKEALHHSASLRPFMCIDLGRKPLPDTTALLEFRKLLHDNQLGKTLFAQVGTVLQSKVFKFNTSTIVDAAIIGAPNSTNNAYKARDPKMRQTHKGQQWYFGTKLHIGVDNQINLTVPIQRSPNAVSAP